ncbi:hypothetical protein [Kitasatospora sp. NPDC001095]
MRPTLTARRTTRAPGRPDRHTNGPAPAARRAATTTASRTSTPLAAHPAVARLVLRRYGEARAATALPSAA